MLLNIFNNGSNNSKQGKDENIDLIDTSKVNTEIGNGSGNKDFLQKSPEGSTFPESNVTTPYS